ncbi:hypothetical protein [Parablautia muri]|uniref:hypothetical protein n=1 Tax=Parablautia muri TaxID=2320879 RepID=UPI00136AD0F4|nr:hypothetical protein [Parablautia muri]
MKSNIAAFVFGKNIVDIAGQRSAMSYNGTIIWEDSKGKKKKAGNYLVAPDIF